MRIISGNHKGRAIRAPHNLPVRPTTDFAKTALFNILNNHFDFAETKVLDLFCGTGNISYEFLSRGCTSVTCVDNNTGCIEFVKEFSEKHFPGMMHAMRSDAFRYIKNCHTTFDIIFADPPFSMSNVWELPDLILSQNILNKNGWLILEHSSHSKPTCKAIISETRKYGHTSFSFFKPLTQSPSPLERG